MHIEQIYTGCLAQGAYYIRSGEEAAIIDPLREVGDYLDRAERDGVRIKYIFETHFHADFVSGHVTLADRTGASIVYGPNAEPDFEAHIAEDGEVFRLGEVAIEALHTPGHTLESTTYLLRDATGKERAIFTGDTLFLGDVGRPDLAQKLGDLTKEDLARMLFRSLREKIMPLPDSVTVYPAHGAGSACGKNMSRETIDTLGNQKRTNYALRADMTEAEFTTEVTEGLQPPPAYFPANVALNKSGDFDDVRDVLAQGSVALPPKDFEYLAQQTGALILDVRSPADFAEAHVPGSIFIGLDGSFAPWVGELIADVHRPILLVVAEGREREAVTRLARVGFDQTLGFLQGGLDAWRADGRETDSVETITAEEFLERSKPASTTSTEEEQTPTPVFDLRKVSEHANKYLADTELVPLARLNQNMERFPDAEPFFIHCAGGYRSMIGASILKARGIHGAINIDGGIKALAEAGAPLLSSAADQI